MALCPGLPKLADTIRNLHLFTPWGRTRRIHTDNKVHCMEAQPLYGALSQRWLSDLIKAACNQSRPDGQVKLTASTFNRLWISMPAVLVKVTTVTQNLLHPLSTSFIIADHLLHFMEQWKITEADTLTIRLDATPSGLSVPHLHHLPFLRQMPFLPQPSQFLLAWDRHRIMLACILSMWQKKIRCLIFSTKILVNKTLLTRCSSSSLQPTQTVHISDHIDSSHQCHICHRQQTTHTGSMPDFNDTTISTSKSITDLDSPSHLHTYIHRRCMAFNAPCVPVEP